MLYIFAVSGCKNVAPPAGAWMTRSGDVIEVGCHSGSKTWTLECEQEQWMGAVGVCGRNGEGNKILPPLALQRFYLQDL